MVSKKPKVLKIVLLTIISLFILFFSLFLFGEILRGEISGLGHLLQIIPLAILWFLVYKFVKI